MTLNLSIGDIVSNKAGDNQGKVMAIEELSTDSLYVDKDGNTSMIKVQAIPHESIVAIRWNTPSVRDHSVVWYDLAQMEACGMKKVREHENHKYPHSPAISTCWCAKLSCSEALEKPVTITCATCGHTRECGKS